MNETVLHILDNALRYSLLFFLISFLIILVYVAVRTRRRRRGLIDYIRSEVDQQYEEKIRGVSRVPQRQERESFSDDRWRVAGRSLIFSLVLTALFFLTISFTPLSFFDNFATTRSWSVQPLRVTSLSYERFHEGFSLDGEVWNQTEEVVEGLQAVVRIFNHDEELLAEVRVPVNPTALAAGSPGNFKMRYEENSPFIHGYRIAFFDSTGSEIPHLQGFGLP